MTSFQLTFLAAERSLYEGDCVSLVIPTVDGQYGIQANHCNTITAIVPGMMTFTTDMGLKVVAAVSEGLAKVENGNVLLLVDTAERPDEIDENRAKLAQEQAREAILQKKSIRDYQAAQARMARAINRLRVKHYEN